MTPSLIDPAGADAANLLVHYGFDLDGYTVDTLMHHWLRQHSAVWLRTAVIEALYQGRYKAVSVEQILTLWQRRGQPRYHFNREFERMVCSKLPRNLLTESVPQELSQSQVVETALLHSELPPVSTVSQPEKQPPEKQQPEKQPSEKQQPEKQQPMQESIANSTDRPAADLPAQDASVAMPTWEPIILSEGWSNREVVKHPIHQFVPPPSNFCAKLKAVSHPGELEPASATAAVLEVADQDRSSESS